MKKPLIIGVIAVLLLASVAVYSLKTSSTPPKSEVTYPDTPDNSPKLISQTVGQPTDCSLYNSEALNGIWGVSFVETVPNNVINIMGGAKQYSCTFNETTEGKGITYIIEVTEYNNEKDASITLSDIRNSEKFGDRVFFNREEVANVGDEAFYWTQVVNEGTQVKNQQMYIRQGSVVFLLSGVNIDGVSPDYKEKLLKSFQLHFE